MKIVFRHIDPYEIILNYFPELVKSIDEKDVEIFAEDTFSSITPFPRSHVSVTQILHEDSKRFETYLDWKQRTVKLWVCMYNTILNGPLPLHTDIPCWWCRCNFDTSPLGVPIQYVSEPEDHIRRGIQAWLEKNNLPTEDLEYFETDGIVCSFPCMKAYILHEGRRKEQYRESLTLMSLLYSRIYGKVEAIEEAGDWRLIDRWGGHLSPLEYRERYGKVYYTETHMTKKPLMYSVGNYIQEYSVIS